MDRLEALTAGVVEAVTAAVDHADAAGIDPISLTFLLRRYRATDAADLRDALGPALALALSLDHTGHSVPARAAWLTLFAEALALSDDERLRAAVDELIASLMRDGAAATSIDATVVAVDACLRACDCVDAAQLVPAAIEQLEHTIGGAYSPGEGVESKGGKRTLEDQIGAASALLTGYEATGRLPYAMLAEELMQTTRRRSWDDRDGGFFDSAPDAATKPFAANCAAARVLCRLAALHRDDGYRAAAVIAEDADYAADAERLLTYLSSLSSVTGPMRTAEVPQDGAAMYGLALAEYMELH
jgi:uncharacterized protein YyaL (SSP411 family)